MSQDLAGQTALVTGAGRGLGQAVALALADAGAAVACLARTLSEVEQTAAEIRSRGGRAIAMPADVASVPALAEAVARTETDLGPLSVLVHAAGTTVRSTALELTESQWDQVLNVNLKSAFFLSQAAARSMADRRYGRIIYIASMLGLVGIGNLAPYGASKSGLIGLTKHLAVEWARYGITVNAVAPGYVETAINRDALADERFRQRILDRTPLRRLGEPEEVAAAARYLASPGAGFVTGHVLTVDGGWTAQ